MTCRVRLNGSEALVQVASSDAAAQNWVPFGKFTLPVTQEQGKFDAVRFADGLAEGVLSRLVRGAGDQGHGEGQGGEAGVPDTDRQCVSVDLEWNRDVGNGEQGGRGAEGVVGDQHLTAAEPDATGD